MLPDVRLPYAYALGPGYPFPLLCLYVAGAALGLLGALLLLVNLIYALRPRWYFLDPMARPQLASGLCNGLLLGLGVGLFGGIVFTLAQIPAGYLSFLPPHTPLKGLACGVGLGILAGALGGRLRSLPLSLVVGVPAGVAAGLVALELISDPLGIRQEAAIGVGTNIGSELALLCGILGGLAGALLVTLVTDAVDHKTHWWLRILIGTVAGLVGGLAIALLGTVSGQFVLVVPKDLVALGWRSLPFWQGTSVVTQGLLYSCTAFGITGLLCGGVVGGLAAPSVPPSHQVREVSPSSATRPLTWATLVLGLLPGLVGGLGYHSIGGAPGDSQLVLSTNPQGGMLALLLGDLLGIAIGIGLALLWNRSKSGPGRGAETGGTRAFMMAGATLALGVVVFWLPGWFSPLVVLFFGGH